MRKLQIQNYEQGDGCYALDGEPKTNFILEVAKIITGKGDSVEYQFRAYTFDMVHTVTVSPKELGEKKFLRVDQLYVEDEKYFYKQLRIAILKKRFLEGEILYRTERNGFQIGNCETSSQS